MKLRLMMLAGLLIAASAMMPAPAEARDRRVCCRVDGGHEWEYERRCVRRGGRIVRDRRCSRDDGRGRRDEPACKVRYRGRERCNPAWSRRSCRDQGGRFYRSMSACRRSLSR